LTQEIVPSMIRALVSLTPDRSLTLGMLRSPSPNRLEDPSVLHIKPGFYVGDFGREDYGNFSREVCLVDYTRLDLGGKVHGEVGARLARLFRGGAPYPFSGLARSGTITLATCVKATGDVHVPLGQMAWVALVEPSFEALSIPELPPLPEGLHDREGRRVNVIRGWPGAGTLAGAGFREARWDFGWLLQLADGHDTRLAFAWQGDVEVIVLSWSRVLDSVRFAEVPPEDWSCIL